MKAKRKCDSIVERMKKFMNKALKEAEKAKAIGEIPIGAVIVKENRIVGYGHNMTNISKDPTAHAEILAIRDAAKNIGGWRLSGCSLYVTMEPCTMCAGAIVLARIEKIYIGAEDPKSGACGSLYNILQDERLNHYVEIETGILKKQCSDIVKDFFIDLRKAKGRKTK